MSGPHRLRQPVPMNELRSGALTEVDTNTNETPEAAVAVAIETRRPDVNGVRAAIHGRQPAFQVLRRRQELDGVQTRNSPRPMFARCRTLACCFLHNSTVRPTRPETALFTTQEPNATPAPRAAYAISPASRSSTPPAMPGDVSIIYAARARISFASVPPHLNCFLNIAPP